MDLGIKGKKALVMASSSGIGKAIAQALLQEGAQVAICARSKTRLEQVAREIKADLAIHCDLSKDGAGGQLVRDAIKSFGELDILVTSSGTPHAGPFSSVSLQMWRDGFESLWMSAVEAMQAALPGMTQRRWGRIVMVNSIAGKEPIHPLTVSNGLRAGLLGLVKSLSREIAPNGVTVNAILPGWTRTEGTLELKIPEEELTKDIPMKRLAEPEEIGSLTAFLCSQQASYITGQAIACDGGFLRGI